MNPKIEIIEEAHFGHFVFLPKKLGFDVHRIDGVTVINCGLQTSMFNIAYGAPRTPHITDVVRHVKQAFANQPFAWWIPPSQHNPDVTRTLLAHGLAIEASEHAMICNLEHGHRLAQTTDLTPTLVTNHALLKDFISVLERSDSRVHAFYGKMSDTLFNADEKLVVGYAGREAVSTGIVFERRGNAGIFTVVTKKEARKKGYGTDMMVFLMRLAKDNGCHFATLSASSDSGYRIYERLGFSNVGAFECFEYSPAVFSGPQSY